MVYVNVLLCLILEEKVLEVGDLHQSGSPKRLLGVALPALCCKKKKRKITYLSWWMYKF